MTFGDFKEHSKHNISEVGVWYCENCLSFHIKAGEVLLTFTKAEFGEFSHAVFDCYASAVTLEDVRSGTNPENEVLDLKYSHQIH